MVTVINEDGVKEQVSEVGVPGLFQPQRWDIEEEFSNNEALREMNRDRMFEE